MTSHRLCKVCYTGYYRFMYSSYSKVLELEELKLLSQAVLHLLLDIFQSVTAGCWIRMNWNKSTCHRLCYTCYSYHFMYSSFSRVSEQDELNRSTCYRLCYTVVLHVFQL